MHHPYGSLATCSLLSMSLSSSTLAVNVVNLMDDGPNEKGKEEKGEESAVSEKSKEMIAFAERQTLENVVLNRDKSDVETLGGTAWTSLSVKATIAFLRKIKVMIPPNKRTSNELGSVIANWINSQGVRSTVAAAIQQKKPAASTKPVCAKMEGTIFHAIGPVLPRLFHSTC
jgi:hypothetical protein